MKYLSSVIGLLLVAQIAIAATPDALFSQGKQALNNGDVDKAVDLLEQAVKAEPKNSIYLLYLGNAYGQAAMRASMFKKPGLASKSLKAMEDAVAADPNNLDARSGLIDFYKMAPGIMGGSDEKALQQAAEIKKRDALLGHRAYARIYTLDKKPELAAKEYTDAIREQPNSAKAHHYYGMYLTNVKDYKQALAEFQTALNMNPPFMPAHYRIGVLGVLTGDYARGEESIKKYLTYTPTEQEPSISNAWYVLGQLYEKQGRKADAKQSYMNALKGQPGAKSITEALKRVS